MNPLLPHSESGTVEFKTSFNDEVIVSLVAFSNTKGGVVYIGMEDSGMVKGIHLGKETAIQWVNEVRNKTVPSIIPDVHQLEVDGKHVIAMKAMEYPVKPVSFRNKYYKRIANSNHLMNTDEIANEHLKTINSSWDFYPDPNHNTEDISTEKVRIFINTIEQHTQSKIGLSELNFLAKLEIIRNNQLTFGGYLLFAKEYCTISDMQIGRFKSPTTIIDSISLNTDLFTEVNEIIAFIKKHLMVEYIITGDPQRAERYNYPLEAIREVVINMVVHRDYRDSSASIIKIFDDRIEFFNPGKLYGNLTIKDLLSDNYTSQTRNKLIAKAFKEAGLIERYGSGIKRILTICKAYGVKEPMFEEVAQGFKVTLFKVTDKVTDRDTDKVTDRVTDKLTANQTQIIRLILSNKNLTTRELAAEIEISQRKIKTNLSKLKSLGLIKRIGPAKGGFWEVMSNET